MQPHKTAKTTGKRLIIEWDADDELKAVISDIVKFMRLHATKRHTPNKDWNRLAKFLSDSDENFEKYTCFIDCFPRCSVPFKLMTAFHVWAIYNSKNYKKQYDRVVRSGKQINCKSVGFTLRTLSDSDVDKILFGK